jgi:hypothetical protein
VKPVTTVLVLLALGLAGCGGGSSHASAGASHRYTNAGVTIQVPPGWSTKSLTGPTGLVIAANNADLEAGAPGGPRLTARVGSRNETPPAELIGGINRSPFAAPQVATTKVAGAPAATVEWTQAVDGTKETTRVVTASLSSDLAYTFTLEAPQSVWEANVSTLEAALSSVSIDFASLQPIP